MNLQDYLMCVIEEKCNSKCSICFIEGTDEELKNLNKFSLPLYKRFLAALPKDKYPGIIFSGGEVTLNQQLLDFASNARDKGFRNIMIQTNARALSNKDKVRQLKSAGINQYFVSFHSADYDLSDRITGRIGAHAQTVKGLENLNELDLMVVTNTVMTSMNYTVLPELAKSLQKFNNIVGMHFWGYVPVTSKAHELMLPYGLAAPYLNETIKYLLHHQKEICVKYFPVCLLNDAYKGFHCNLQPIDFGLLIRFIGKRFRDCHFKTYSCCNGTDCMGLPEIYLKKMPPGSWTPSHKVQKASNS